MSAMYIRRMAEDVLKETYRRMDRVEYIKQDNFNTVAYEIGYMIFVINEKYRKMIDKFNTTMRMEGALYQMELLMYLQDIEMYYWEIEHLAHMLHEVERKYDADVSVVATYHEKDSIEVREEKIAFNEARKKKHKNPLSGRYPFQTTTRKKKMLVLNQYLLDKLNPTVTSKTRWWWPTEYGWEIDYWW